MDNIIAETSFSSGIKDTLKRMGNIIEVGSKNNEIRKMAVSAMAGSMPGSLKRDHAIMIFDYIRNLIRYVDDIDQIETLQDALLTIHNGFGDCDDMTIALGSLLKAVGFPVGLVAVQMKEFNDYNHVYLVCYTSEGFIFFDATNKTQPAGWQLPDIAITKRLIMLLMPSGYIDKNSILEISSSVNTITYYEPGSFDYKGIALAGAIVFIIFKLIKR